MRLNTPINRETLKNHMTYSAWKYALLIVCVVMGMSLIFTVTAYRSPQNKRVDVYVQSATTTSEQVDAFLEPIWKSTVPEMETVSSVVLTPLDDYTTAMQLMAYMAAGDADIYFLNEQTFKSYASQGSFLELEGLVENGTLEVGDIDLTKGYVTYIDDYDENGKPLNTSIHLFGIPLDTFFGYMGGMALDNRSMYAVITVNNQNDENVIPFFNALLQAGRGEKEDWITD